MKLKFPAGWGEGQSLIFKAKLIPSHAGLVGGKLENQIYCFIKVKHSIWKNIPLCIIKLRGHILR